MIPCLHDKLIFQRELIDNLAAPRGRLLFDLRVLLTVFGFTCFVSITKPGLEVCSTSVIILLFRMKSIFTYLK